MESMMMMLLVVLLPSCLTVVFGGNCSYKDVSYESHKTYIHPDAHQACNLCTCSPTLVSRFSCTSFNCQQKRDDDSNKCAFIQQMELGDSMAFFSGCMQCQCTESGVECVTNKLKCDVQLNLECEYEGGEHKYSPWMTWPMNDNCNEYCTCLAAGIPACSIEAMCSTPADCGEGRTPTEMWNKSECGYCYCPPGGKAACGHRACESNQFHYQAVVGAAYTLAPSLAVILIAASFSAIKDVFGSDI